MDNEIYMNEKEVAAMLRLSIQALRNWRWRRTGLPYYKVGGRILYRRAEVIMFADANRVVPNPKFARSVRR